MFVKKKKGVVLIEANIFLMIVLSIFSASSKLFTSNIEKRKYLYSREDTKAISYLEYEFLSDFNNFILEDKENYLKIKSGIDTKKTKTEIYTNSNYNNYSIIYDSKHFYINHKKSNLSKYMGIDEYKENESIYFKTNTYKTDYIFEAV